MIIEEEMIEEVISWGVKPSAITTDCWYASKKNLRFFRNIRCDKSKLMDWTRVEFRELQEIHWGIECYHRALKQLCGLSKFQVRKTKSIITHIFCSLRAFCQLELMRIKETIESWYSLQRELSLKVAREFILEQLSSSASLTA